jgi:hypothetical protein
MSAALITRPDLTLSALPPLGAITPSEWAEIVSAAIASAERELRAKDLAAEAVAAGYLKLHTTHPWSPSKYALRRHFLFLVHLACKDWRESQKADKRAREEEAHEKFYDDVVEDAPGGASPEDLMVAREDLEEHQLWILEKRDQLRRLQRLVAGDVVALALLRAFAEYGEDRPLSQIAEIIGYPAPAVYSAKKRIERLAARVVVERADASSTLLDDGDLNPLRRAYRADAASRF